MRDTAVCRNYAETLLAVAEKDGKVERYGDLIDAVAGVMAADPALHGVFMSPRVPKETKQHVIDCLPANAFIEDGHPRSGPVGPEQRLKLGRVSSVRPARTRALRRR